MLTTEITGRFNKRSLYSICACVLLQPKQLTSIIYLREGEPQQRIMRHAAHLCGYNVRAEMSINAVVTTWFDSDSTRNYDIRPTCVSAATATARCTDAYEGRSINKLQNIVILLVFQI